MKSLLIILILILSLQQLRSEEIEEIPEVKDPKKINFDFTTGMEKLSGYTRYQIGGFFVNPDGTYGRTYFPLSELKFPLNVYMVSANSAVTVLEKIKIDFCFKKNFTSRAGKMKDSDWGIRSNNSSSLEIFSESDSRLNFYSIDSCLSYILFNKEIISLNIGMRFLYQYFSFDISNLNQWDYFPSTGQTQYTVVDGKVLTYKAKYYIPYMHFSSCIVLDSSFYITAVLDFSPVVVAKDFDDHILRGKSMKGKSNGSSFHLSLNAKYYFNKIVYIGLALDHIWIDCTGTQTQYYYRDSNDDQGKVIPEGTTLSIGNALRSVQSYIGLNAGCSFQF